MLGPGNMDMLFVSGDEAIHLIYVPLIVEIEIPVAAAQPAPKGKLGAITGDAYTASRVLFPADWAPMAKAQDGVLIVALPRPSTILYVGDDSPDALGALRALAHQQMAAAPDGLSDRLLRWTPAGWQVVN